MNKFKYLLLYILIIVLYIVFLTLSSCIPNDIIKKNMIESSKELIAKNEKTGIQFLGKEVILFNFTDALMLNTIYSVDNEKPLETALLARRNYIKDSKKKIYEDTTPPGENNGESAEYENDSFQTKELWETVNGRDTYNCIEYARYWHGYMIILKPLLIVFKYSQIQNLSMITWGILSIVFLYLIAKKIGIKEAIAFLLAFVITDLYICSASLNAMIPFYIAIIAGTIILLKEDKIKSYNFIFLVVGSVTAFFDLLTTPIVTLGIPLIVKVLVDYKKRNNCNICEILKDCLYWVIGYSTTMILKWIITDVFLGRNVLNTSIKQLLYRIGDKSEDINYTVKLSLLTNICFLNKYIIICILLIFLCAIIYKVIKNKYNCIDIPVLMISGLPVFWIMILKNHSTIHRFFTYRNLVITLICILIIIFESVNVRKDKTKNERNQ